MDPKGKQEISMEARLLLAFLLMAGVLFLTQYFFQQQPPPKKKEDPAAAAPAAPAPAQVPASGPAKAVAPTSPTPASAAVQADREEQIVIETDVFRVTFSNRGATVRSWILKQYRDNAGNLVELVNAQAFEKVGAPLSLHFPQNPPDPDPNTALWAFNRSDDGLAVSFEYSTGQATYRKSLRFQKASYLVDLTSEVIQGGVLVAHQIAWRGGFGDSTVHNAAATQHTVAWEQGNKKLIINDYKKGSDSPFREGGNFAFAGLEDQYFAAVALADNPSLELITFTDTVKNPAGTGEEPHVGAAVGGGGRLQVNWFVGPKDLDILRSVNPKLEQMVDWGWFWFLAKPLFRGLHWLHDSYIHNWGWSIVVVTILINLLMLPLKFSSLQSSRKLSALAPELKAINEKYKGISVRDPRKQQQNEEVMALYKKHGVNPLGGCVPLLLQIPVFIAFYKVLTVAIELRGADWLWVTDLSRPETLPLRVLPILMIVTQFILQKMTPSPGMDPAQQRIMLMMPLFLGYMFYYQSAGLVLYWLTGNLVGIIQQWIINRMSPAPAANPVVAARKKGK